MCSSSAFGCGTETDDQKNLYLNAIKWSRYGNISKAKWQVKQSSGSYVGSWSDVAPEEEEDDEG